MTTVKKQAPKKAENIDVIAIRKFCDEKGNMIEAGQTATISKTLAKKFQDSGVIKVSL